MNDEATPTAAAPAPPANRQLEQLVREHPITAVLSVVGIGCAFGLLARELLNPPPPPKHRALQLLEDIQCRLAELAGPARHRVTGLAEDGADAVRRSMHSLADTKLGDRLKRWFD